LATFAFVAGVTPGPNNLMLMTSGVKYGLGRTVPHLAGVILGFGLMIALVGLGLDILFRRFPQILPIMRVAGSIYMVWLGSKSRWPSLSARLRPADARSGFLPQPAFSGSIPRPG
jgi:threonine/homoserine/homoserine lactone efflux protein